MRSERPAADRSRQPASRWSTSRFALAPLATLAALTTAACGGNLEDPIGGTTSGGTTTTTAGTASTSTSTTTTTTAATGVIGVTGGTLDLLDFAIVGDTRPPNVDDTAGYPTAVVTKIWQDVEAYSPHPSFAITTGDYMFASIYGKEQAPQMALYLGARKAFGNVVFPALGNHECTGATASNCGPGNANGMPVNYTTFLADMLAPIHVTLPYYTVSVASPTGAWTAKFVFVAGNAWDATQESWLDAELAKPTTYTFVVRHEGVTADTAPGVTPSAAVMAKHPYTLLLAGHTHTFSYSPGQRQVITGNGGAPLSGNVNYGYVIAKQRADGAIAFSEIDYLTNVVAQTFAVKADGTPAP
jgi:hypothetical protein